MLDQVSPIGEARPPFVPQGSLSPEVNRPGTGYKGRPNHMPYATSQDITGSPYTPITNTPPIGYPNSNHPNGVDYIPHDGYGHIQGQRPQHQSPPGAQRLPVQASVGPYGVLSPVSTQHGYHSQSNNTPQSTSVYMGQQNFPAFSLPPSDFSQTTAAPVSREAGQYAPQNLDYTQHGPPQSTGEMMLLDNIPSQTTIPVFGTDGVLNKSPYVGMPEDFMAYLFNTGSQQGDGSTLGQMTPQQYPTKYALLS